jgi:hypothetical protein
MTHMLNADDVNKLQQLIEFIQKVFEYRIIL